MRYASRPACAIMMPLSMQKRSSVANTCPPRSLAMVPIISCRRWFEPTPPTTSTSRLPICAIARSVISTSIANTCSWRLKHKSAPVIMSPSACSASSGSSVARRGLCAAPVHRVPFASEPTGSSLHSIAGATKRGSFVYASVALSIPASDTSMPLVAYGRGSSRRPRRAARSIL